MNFLKQKTRNKQSGFALIKTVIAIGLLATVLTVSVKLIGISAKTIQNNRQETTALYLAQQCVEWTRNIRDTAWKKNLPWDCGFKDSLGNPFLERALHISSGDSTGSCKDNAGSGKDLGFVLPPYSDVIGIVERKGSPSIYKRKVLFTPTTGVDEIKIECQISWKGKSLSLSHILTDWKK